MEPNQQLIANAIRAAAINAAIVDQDLIAIIPTSEVRVDAGRVVGAVEAVQAFKVSKPHFFPGVGSMDSQKYRAHRQSTIAALRERNQVEVPQPAKPVAEMDRKEYNRHRQAVTKALGRRGRR